VQEGDWVPEIPGIGVGSTMDAKLLEIKCLKISPQESVMHPHSTLSKS